MPEDNRNSYSQKSTSEQEGSRRDNSRQDGPIRQEVASADELPLTQLKQQLQYRKSSGDPMVDEGRLGGVGPSVQQKGAQDRVWAVFMLRVVPQPVVEGAEAPAGKR